MYDLLTLYITLKNNLEKTCTIPYCILILDMLVKQKEKTMKYKDDWTYRPLESLEREKEEAVKLAEYRLLKKLYQEAKRLEKKDDSYYTTLKWLERKYDSHPKSSL